MTRPELGAVDVWLLVGAVGIVTYGLRLSFIQLYGRLEAVPPRIERGLELVPAAILAALVSSALFAVGGSVVETVVDARVLAVGVAAVVAWRTGSILATICVGMVVLWGLRLAVG